MDTTAINLTTIRMELPFSAARGGTLTSFLTKSHLPG
jgi:hypothetical protein